MTPASPCGDGPLGKCPGGAPMISFPRFGNLHILAIYVPSAWSANGHQFFLLVVTHTCNGGSEEEPAHFLPDSWLTCLAGHFCWKI